MTGEILLGGAPATPADARAAVAAVLQRPILRRGTVAANAASGLRFRGLPGARPLPGPRRGSKRSASHSSPTGTCGRCPAEKRNG